MEHPCDLAGWIGDLLLDEKTSDMTFVVEEESLPAHKAILASSCEYFRALLCGNMKESLQSRVHLKDITLRGFKLLLSYIYTGQLKLKEWDDETTLEVLHVAHIYGFEKVETALHQHLEEKFSVENICMIFEKALFLRLKDFTEACCVFMDRNTSAILASETFYDLPAAAIYHILSRDTFCGEEIDFFEAVQRWYATHPTDDDRAKILEAIRFPLIATVDLVTTIKESGLISADRLFEALRMSQCHTADLKFRAARVPEENLATQKLGATELREKPCGKIRTPTTCSSYDSVNLPSGYFTVNYPAGFYIALSDPFFVNHITFDLRLNNSSTTSTYFIEVSVNLEDWFRLIDHSIYGCYSFQKLYFEPRVIRYVRIFSASGENFYAQNFQALYTERPFKLACGFYAPEKDVASSAYGATVVESLDKSDAMIRQITVDNQDESKWTSHKIGTGSIMIRLSQPYTVNSLQMLLKEHYLYYIETSLDESNWTRVADRTKDLCSSWQTIHFEPIAVLFIKIVGTGSTGVKVFKCAHFECPAPVTGPPKANEAKCS